MIEDDNCFTDEDVIEVDNDEELSVDLYNVSCAVKKGWACKGTVGDLSLASILAENKISVDFNSNIDGNIEGETGGFNFSYEGINKPSSLVNVLIG